MKPWAYVAWVALFSTLAVLLYGSWVDGTNLGVVALYLLTILALVAVPLWWFNHKSKAQRPALKIR